MFFTRHFSRGKNIRTDRSGLMEKRCLLPQLSNAAVRKMCTRAGERTVVFGIGSREISK